MSHKKAKLARRLARQLMHEQSLAPAPDTHITTWKPVLIESRRLGKKVRIERPQVRLHPHTSKALAKKIQEDL